MWDIPILIFALGAFWGPSLGFWVCWEAKVFSPKLGPEELRLVRVATGSFWGTFEN